MPWPADINALRVCVCIIPASSTANSWEHLTRVDVNKPHVRLLKCSGLFRGVGDLKLLRRVGEIRGFAANVAPYGF